MLQYINNIYYYAIILYKNLYVFVILFKMRALYLLIEEF